MLRQGHVTIGHVTTFRSSDCDWALRARPSLISEARIAHLRASYYIFCLCLSTTEGSGPILSITWFYTAKLPQFIYSTDLWPWKIMNRALSKTIGMKSMHPGYTYCTKTSRIFPQIYSFVRELIHLPISVWTHLVSPLSCMYLISSCCLLKSILYAYFEERSSSSCFWFCISACMKWNNLPSNTSARASPGFSWMGSSISPNVKYPYFWLNP